MSAAVDQILTRRARRDSRRPEAVSLGVAALLHIAVVAIALLLPRLTPPPEPLSFVPVQIIPAQALGVRKPASRPRAEKPAPPRPEPVAEGPAPVAAEPEPEPARPEPKPEPPKPERSEAPVLPDKKPEKKPDVKPEKPRPATTPSSGADTTAKPAGKPAAEPPKPASRTGGTGENPAGTVAQGTPDGPAGRRGGTTGSPLGTSAFGSELAGLDNPDFTYGYYIDQLLSLIDDRWVRPPMGDDVRATISFRIGRDGSMSDLRVSESSGYNSFDLAALRAVQNAAPFPPLPRGFKHDSLGVNLIVR
jgi:TonB family protein